MQNNPDFRQSGLQDRLVNELDTVLRSLFGGSHEGQRPSPAEGLAEGKLTPEQRTDSGRLMRVNHSGEVAAQALYQGHFVTARSPKVRQMMQAAASEELDHLHWCETRLKELNTPLSILNPVWYLGSFLLGAASGLAGDRISLGMVEATEDRVVQHLQEHLEKTAPEDKKTLAILEQMQKDEAEHASNADRAGASRFPAFIRRLMTRAASVMTRSSHWV